MSHIDYIAENQRLKEENSALKKALEIAKKGYVDCMSAKRYPDSKCAGYQHSDYDDEPCEQCKECPMNEFYEED